MAKKTIADVDVAGKTVLMRVDFNVPLDDRQRSPTTAGSGWRCRRSNRAGPRRTLILMSHLGRPKGEGPEPEVQPQARGARGWANCCGKRCRFATDTIGDDARGQGGGAWPTATCWCWRTSASTPARRRATPSSPQALAAMADVYCNDAFGTCHRTDASMVAVPKAMGDGKPKVVGFLVAKEIEYLADAIANPKRPFVAILGGAKVSDKIKVIENLLEICDKVLIGGAMAYTFSLAQGGKVGDSLVEAGQGRPGQGTARRRRRQADAAGRHHCGDAFKADCNKQVVSTGEIPDGYAGSGHRPEDGRAVRRRSSTDAKTVVWNGPMGVFEMPPFDAGHQGRRPGDRRQPARSASSAAATARRPSSSSASPTRSPTSAPAAAPAWRCSKARSSQAVELLDEK